MNTGNSVKFVCAVLAGGSGTRLWPLSVSARPKPFVPLGKLGTLYSATLARATALDAYISTVASGGLRAHCESPGVSFLEEPGARNTAAAVALAAAAAAAKCGEDAVLVVLPSDHWIEGDFAGTVRDLATLCIAEGALGVMGIEPAGPETGYGYLEAGEACGVGFSLARFTEKPDRKTAEAMLETGRYSWNSGMFVYPIGVLHKVFSACAPGVWEAAEAWLQRRDPAPYLSLPSISVDYAVMEKAPKVVGMRARFAWSDVGNFASIHQMLEKDGQGNSGWGPGRVEACQNCLVVTHRRETLVRGLQDTAFVETEAGLLVTPLCRSEEIRPGVEAILRG